MEITDVKIFKTKRRGLVLAYANVILDNKFIIRGITLLEKRNKRYVSMPARRVDGGRRYRDICHPIDSNIREELTNVIFKAYEEFLETEK